MSNQKDSAVYALRCNATGKMYIGSTAHLDSRLRQHMTALRENKHPVSNMQKDYNKHGGDFSVCVLADYLPNDTTRTKIESLYMTILGTRNPESGYNYLDNTRDVNVSKLKFYPITVEPVDKVYDPRKRLERTYKKPNRTKIYELRKSAEMSGRELAEILGVTRQTVSLWEIGETSPSSEMLNKIADYFGVTVDELLRKET